MPYFTNVPTVTYGPSGFIIPQESAILAGVLADYNAAFGGNLNLALNTPQGQLASSTTGIIGNTNDTFLFLTNQFNPAFSEGRWQDGIANIYFITRNPSLPTVVIATCSGLNGTLISAGALAQASDGNVYTCTVPGTIASGTCQATFTCNVSGAIPCAAGALNTIYQSILGWDSITNVDAGVIGQDVEGRQDFETRRFASVSGNSLGAMASVQGAVLSVAGVLDAYVTQNYTSAPVTIGGYSVAANSIYVAVVGGTSTDVANAIWTKKSPGCNMNGNTAVTVYDTSYELPYPTYTIHYETPAALPIIFAVNIANNSGVPSNADILIQNVLISAFAGGDGGPRARIGSAIYTSRFYAPVAALGPWVQIISIQIGCQNNPAAHCPTGSISTTTFTEGGSVTGSFAIGQTLVDATGHILPGTVILSGSSPTWTINNSQTVSSELIYGILADQNDVLAQIDQSPNLSAVNIVVTAT